MSKKSTKTIALNMIVKNESKVIQRCLSSVMRLIDYWVIVDTGSTDGTQKIIKELMKRVPGELHERPWVDFSHNRNEVLQFAKKKADYSLFIDADEQLVFAKNFVRPALDKDKYLIKVHTQTHVGARHFLVNNLIDWRWEGVLHERLTAPSIAHYAILEDVVIAASFFDGYRSQDPQKHLNDAKILEKALETDPSNARYTFYLAQSYAKTEEYPLAIRHYEKRATMGEDVQEVFWSLYGIACLQEMLKMSSETIISSYWRAHHFRPSRAEPLFSLAQYCFTQEQYPLAYQLSKFALPLPFPTDIGNVVHAIYDYALLDLFARSAFKLSKLEEAREAYQKLLQRPTTPSQLREQISKNPF